MGFDVRVVVEFKSSPHEPLITALDHQFGSVGHAAGSKIVTLTEHVSMSNQADAVEFVRGLVLDAIPDGSKISEISATPG